MPLEIEVKFYLSETEPFKGRLASLEANFIKKVSETNIRFENKDKNLYQQKSLLRLRQADNVTLTYKAEPAESNTDFKVHHEIEVIVNDFDAMRQILESIGFHQEQIYEKKRETWLIDQTTICVDLMPYGQFVEIEGEPAKIQKISKDLGFDWKNRILFNYLKIFEILKQQLNFPFSDVTFDNFKTINVDFNRYLDLFTSK